MSIYCGIGARGSEAIGLACWIAVASFAQASTPSERGSTPTTSVRSSTQTTPPASSDDPADVLGETGGETDVLEDAGPPPPPPPPDGLLPITEMTRFDFAPRDRPKPLLYGPRLVIVSESGIVEGHDASTGEFAWKLGLSNERLFDPVVFDGVPLVKGEPAEFTVVLSTRAGHILILDGPSGEIRQEAWLPFELALPPVKGPGNTIFLATPSGDIVGYDVEREVVLFQTATGETPAALASTDTALIVSGSTQVATGITLPQGEIAWKLTGRAGFLAPAAFDEEGERAYLGDDTGELYCVDAGSGKIKFRWSTGAAIRSKVLVEEDRIFVATFANWLFAFRANNGHELWRSNLPGRPSTAPIRIGGRLLVATFDGILVEIHPQRGQLGKSYQAPGEIIHTPSFFVDTPSEQELEAMETQELADDTTDDTTEDEVLLDPDIFGPAEMLDLDEPTQASERADSLLEESGAEPTLPLDPNVEPREPAWFERSRVAMALRNGQVLLLKHQVATSAPSVGDDAPPTPGAPGPPDSREGAPPRPRPR